MPSWLSCGLRGRRKSETDVQDVPAAPVEAGDSRPGKPAKIGLSPKPSYKPASKPAKPPVVTDFEDADFVNVERASVLGLVKIRIQEADLNAKGNYNLTLSMGLQSFLSRTCVRTASPQFEAENNMVITREGAHTLHCVVHRVKYLDAFRHDPVGIASIDLLQCFHAASARQAPGSKLVEQWFDLHPVNVDSLTASASAPTLLALPGAPALAAADALPCSVTSLAGGLAAAASTPPPAALGDSDGDHIQALGATDATDAEGGASSHKPVAGRLRVSIETTGLETLENDFWTRMLALADHDASGMLEFEEFDTLLRTLIGERNLPEGVIQDLWEEADGLTHGAIDAPTLSRLLTEKRQHKGFRLMTVCPITGRALRPDDDFGNIVYMTLALDGGLSSNLQGGYRTAAQANRGWMMQMSEWITQPLAGSARALVQGNAYDPGLNVGANASHVIVYHRGRRVLVEETISPAIVLAMRNMYQSRMGRLMKATGMFRYLKTMSEEKGRQMDDPASAADIPRFLRAFGSEISVDEIAEPLESFRTFNAFFHRALKPGARPIAHPEDGTVLVSAADARLMAFESIDEATLFWVKGKHFSVRGLLADQYNSQSEAYNQGSLLIFRLAPQDYHRFHCPCDSTVVSIVDIPGQLYTVNPIAVNSTFCDVFTENKRAVVTLETAEFGVVKFVAVGATLVGSIEFSVRVGDRVAKGQELGYFKFGGSTCLVLFEPLKLVLDSDLVKMSRKSIETYVKMGERVGKAPGSSDVLPLEGAAHVPDRVSDLASTVMLKWQTTMRRRQLRVSLQDSAPLEEGGARVSANGAPLTPSGPASGYASGYASPGYASGYASPYASSMTGDTPHPAPSLTSGLTSGLATPEGSATVRERWQRTADGAFLSTLGRPLARLKPE